MVNLSKIRFLILSILAVTLVQGCATAKYASSLGKREAFVFPTNAWQEPTTGQWQVPLNLYVFERREPYLFRKVMDEVMEESWDVFDKDIPFITGPSDANRMRRRTGMFLVDTEEFDQLTVKVDGQELSVWIDEDDGALLGLFSMPTKQQDWLHYQINVGDSRAQWVDARAQLLDDTGISVISDIDDTIKDSQVAKKIMMVKKALIDKYKPVKNMPAIYQSWHQQGAAFHYLSASPWQLFPDLQEFLKQYRFPDGSMHLRNLKLMGGSIQTGKRAVITRLMDQYPHRRFILVGDSTQYDPEIYVAVAQERPNQVMAVMIRHVKDKKSKIKDTRKRLNVLPKEKVWVFESAKSLKAFQLN